MTIPVNANHLETFAWKSEDLQRFDFFERLQCANRKLYSVCAYFP